MDMKDMDMVGMDMVGMDMVDMDMVFRFILRGHKSSHSLNIYSPNILGLVLKLIFANLEFGI